MPARSPGARQVESCHRACDRVDRFERRNILEPYNAPPGTVPYHRYIEAQNRISRLERPEGVDRPEQHKPLEPNEEPQAPAPAPLDEPRPRPDVARIGDVAPVPEESPPVQADTKRPEGISEYREAMTGRLIDVVY